MPSKNPMRRRAPRGTGQRTRTGCATCKARRVKCDEAKPFCRRCVDGGHRCEGYGPVEAPRRTMSRSPPHRMAPSMAYGSTSLIPRIQWKAEERRSIDFFQQETVPGLTSDFGSEFWSRYALQIGHHEPAVKHALAALGAVHEAKTIALTHGPGSDDEVAVKQLSLQQYNYAIRELSKCMTNGDENSKPAALACCLILVALESLQQNPTLAMEHLSGGIKIYRSWARAVKSPTGRSVAVDESQDDLDRSLFELFYRLDSQASGFLDTRHPELVRTSINTAGGAPSSQRGRTASPPSAGPSAGPSFHDASPAMGTSSQATPAVGRRGGGSIPPPSTPAQLKTQLEDIHKDILIFLIENQPYRHVPRKYVPGSVVAHHTDLHRALTEIRGDVETCVTNALLGTPTSKTDRLRGPLMLQLAWKVLSVMVDNGHCDKSWEAWEQEYEGLCELAEQVIDLDLHTASSAQSAFESPPSFDAGHFPAARSASSPAHSKSLAGLPRGHVRSSSASAAMPPISEEHASQQSSRHASPMSSSSSGGGGGSSGGASGTAAPRFSLDATLVPALLLTSRAAPLTSTRERAVALLKRANVQEGMWSSQMAAAIAQKCLDESKNDATAEGLAPKSVPASFVQLQCRYELDDEAEGMSGETAV